MRAQDGASGAGQKTLSVVDHHKKQLVKLLWIFRIWDGVPFFDKHILHEIEQCLHLRESVSRRLSNIVGGQVPH